MFDGTSRMYEADADADTKEPIKHHWSLSKLEKRPNIFTTNFCSTINSMLQCACFGIKAGF